LDYLLIIFPVIISYLAVWLGEQDEMKKNQTLDHHGIVAGSFA